MKTFRQWLLTEKYNPDAFEGIEQFNTVKDVLSSYEAELAGNKSSGKRVIFIVKSSDREKTKEQLQKELSDVGIRYVNEISNLSSVEPTFVDLEQGKRISIVYKPTSGGMNETTVNASITELFPVIAYEKNYIPKNIDDFYKFILNVDLSTVNGILNSKDRKSAKKYIEQAESSSKFKEKMGNAINILEYLHHLSQTKPIEQVYWGYRAKPAGVQNNNPGDIFVKFIDGKMLGVSLKAGGKKTKEPQLNTFVKPVLEYFNKRNLKNEISRYLYQNVYSLIPNFIEKYSERTYDSLRGSKKRDIIKTLDNFEKREPKKYDELYDNMLEYVKYQIINVFNEDKDATLKWIRTKILKQDDSVPVVVIKAVPSGWKEVNDKNKVGELLPVAKVIRAYESKTSKQTFFIDILTNTNESATMEMSIRTNKAGAEHKLGQFYNLALKYNGLK